MPHSNKVVIFLDRKDYKKALIESELAITKNPELAEGWFFTGILNEHQGNDIRATYCYEKSIQIFTNRINNPDKQDDVNANKLNRALSKKFLGDESFIEDLNELRKDKDYIDLVHEIENKTKQELMKGFIK